MNRSTLWNIIRLICVSLGIACITYLFDLWFFSIYPEMLPAEASFLEGVTFIILGALFLLGSGGISETTRRAATTAAAAKAMGKDVIGPSETYRRDAWKPKGFKRLGLIFVMTGIILILIYLFQF
jgi:hypothetical protein